MEKFSLWGNSSDLRRLPLSFEHHLAKAKRMPLVDWEIVASYDKPKSEFRVLTKEVAVMDLSFFTFVRVTGSERVESLNKLLTREISDMGEGDGRRALLLNDAGGIVADVEVIMMKEALLLVALPTMPPDRLITSISRHLLSEDVDFADASEHLVAMALLGENRGWLARALGVEAPGIAGTAMKSSMMGDSSVNIFRSELLGKCLMLLTKEKFATPVWKTIVAGAKELGGLPVGWEAFTAWRIEQGLLWHQADYDADVLPHEAGLEHAISEEKEDYPGYEAVRRYFGKTPTRDFIGLVLDAKDPPPKDAAVHFPEGMPAGLLKSVGFSYSHNKWIATAIIKRREPLPYSPMLIKYGDSGCEGRAVPLPFPQEFNDIEDD